jgi:hypothetical protein
MFEANSRRDARWPHSRDGRAPLDRRQGGAKVFVQVVDILDADAQPD